jgi:hypothetical protein
LGVGVSGAVIMALVRVRFCSGLVGSEPLQSDHGYTYQSLVIELS